MYGDSEEIVGKWFKRTGKRSDIFLATKFGYVLGSPTYETDSSPEYCKKCCEDSLKTLGVDFIDLCKYSILITLTHSEEYKTVHACVSATDLGMFSQPFGLKG